MKTYNLQNNSESVLQVIEILAQFAREQRKGLEKVITEIFAPITPPMPGNYLIGKKEMLRMLFHEVKQWLSLKAPAYAYRSPVRAWHERSSGLGLEEILALFSAVLQASGIPHNIRAVRYNQVWCHGYITVPDHRHDRGYFVLDVCKTFDEEATGFNDSAELHYI